MNVFLLVASMLLACPAPQAEPAVIETEQAVEESVPAETVETTEPVSTETTAE